MENSIPDPPDSVLIKETNLDPENLKILLSTATPQGWTETVIGVVLLMSAGFMFIIQGIPGYLLFMLCLFIGFALTGKGVIEGTASYEITISDNKLNMIRKAFLETKPETIESFTDIYVSTYDVNTKIGTRVNKNSIQKLIDEPERKYAITINSRDEIVSYNLRLDMKTAVWLVDTLRKTAQVQMIMKSEEFETNSAGS